MISTPDSSIRQRTGFGGLAPSQPRRAKPQEAPRGREALMPPERRGFTSIPAPEVLEQLIGRAIEALRAGIFWDLGSILNIVT